MRKERFCGNCGKKYQGARPYPSYCSEECKNAFLDERYKDALGIDDVEKAVREELKQGRGRIAGHIS